MNLPALRPFTADERSEILDSEDRAAPLNAAMAYAREYGAACAREERERCAALCDEDAKEFGHPMKRAGAEACAIRLRAIAGDAGGEP